MSDRRNGHEIRPQEFLERIAAFVEPQFYLFLGRKDWVGGTGKFREYKFKAAALHDGDKITNGKTPDLYFCPNGFTRNKRQRTCAAGKARLLYADLDEIDPYSLEGDLKPQVAWETSPGRFQCMWILDKGLGPRAFERLNKAVTYHIKADKGGWSWTKYLRLPGCVSNKHDEPFTVRLLWGSWDATTDTAALRRAVRGALDVSDPASGAIDLPTAMGPEIARKYWSVLSARGKKLVRAKEVRSGDDRSAKMWDLHMACAEAGMSTGEMVRVVQGCVYNKYRGQRREVRALWTEADKARKRATEGMVAATPTVVPEDDGEPELNGSVPRFQPIRMAKYMAHGSRAPGWLVDQVWALGAHGWWAGEEKTFKSTLLMDLAISVASGMPFLGYYDIPSRGPVLMIQEENAPGFMRSKIDRITQSKALGGDVEENANGRSYVKLPKDPPVFLLNQHRFDLNDQEDMSWLEWWIRANEPKLVILDPFYKVSGGADENTSVDVSPMLNHIQAISSETETAVIIAHHFKKADDQKRSSRKMSGSGVMGRWWASAVFVDLIQGGLHLEFQHREHPDSEPVNIKVLMDEDDETHYDIEQMESGDTVTEDSTIDLNGNDPRKLGMIEGEWMALKSAANQMGMTERALRTAVGRCKTHKMQQVEGKAGVLCKEASRAPRT